MKPEALKLLLSLASENPELGQMLTKLGNENAAQLMTQPGGLFAICGIDENVISTHVHPQGIGSVLLPPIPSNIDDPRYGVFTGYDATTGTNPDYPCDDAPSGVGRSGVFTATWGRVAQQTKTIEITKLLHQGRGMPTNLNLIGDIFGDANFMGNNMSSEGMLDLVVKAEMVGAMVQLERQLSKMVWQGNPGNNSAHGGYKEFPGLDSLVATGKIDIDTSTAIPALDSYIENFALADVTGTTRDIVERLSFMIHYLETLADQTGLSPVEFVIAMRPELWWEITSVWACRYLTNRCTNAGGTGVITINDDTAVKMRDEMRNGKYLIANGKRYTVVTDDGIEEDSNITRAGIAAGKYASSIFVLPKRVRSSFPALYFETIDYKKVNTQLSPLGAGKDHLMFWTDNGRFMWTLKQNRTCFDLQVFAEPRIILRTPHLAGRIDDVLYSPIRHYRSPYPESAYFVQGGGTSR